MKPVIIISMVLTVLSTLGLAEDYTYQCRKETNHVIHIVTLNPQKFNAALIKGHNQVIGRETIEEIAKRTGADIAINSGFFEIGNSQDGMPSGTLIINHQIYGLTLRKHACLVQDQKQFKIQEIDPHVTIKVGKILISPTKVNKSSVRNDVTLYSYVWGSRTFTPLKERQEISISQEGKVVEISKQGNVAIPYNGYVLSVPIHYPLRSISRGDDAEVQVTPLNLNKPEKESYVRGIPILVSDGKINPAVAEITSQYYKSPHARTAFGIRPNGDLVIVVVEHFYKRPLREVTLDEVKSVISKNKLKIMAKYKKPLLDRLTLAEMKEVVHEEYVSSDSVVGLSLPELAGLMKELGCDSAINLDGGGSSSLYLKNRVVNRTVGDKDEGLGQTTLRPISDAIIFRQVS